MGEAPEGERAERGLAVAGGVVEQSVRWLFLFGAIGIVLAWAVVISVADAGDKWVWGGATLGLALFGLLAAYRPMWAVYACLLLTGTGIKVLYGWRDPTDSLYRPVEQAQLSAFGQQINMDSIEASILLIAACMILFRHRERLRGLRKMVLPFAAFLAVLVFTWVLNGAKLYGIKTAGGLVTPILFAAAVYAALEPGRDRARLEIVLYLSIALSIGVGELGQLLFGKPLLAVSGGELRFCGGTSPPVFCTACSVPLALAYSRAIRGQTRGWLLVGALLFLIGSTLTRAHVGAAMIVLLGGAFLAKRHKRRAFLVALLLILLVVFAFSEPLQKRTFGPAKLSGCLMRLYIAAEDIPADMLAWRRLDTSGRSDVWEAYWRLAKRRPLCGYGPGSAYQLGGDFAFTEMRTPHNAYLRLVVETGLFGVTAYFGAMLYFLALVFRRRGGEGPSGIWADAAVFGLLLFLLVACVGDVLYLHAFPAAVLALAAVGITGTKEGARSY